MGKLLASKKFLAEVGQFQKARLCLDLPGRKVKRALDQQPCL